MSIRTAKKIYIYSAVLGIVLWYTYELRLNGVTLLILFALCHLVFLIKEKKFKKADIILNILPYITFIFLKLLFDYLILLPATSNSGDLNNGNYITTWDNICALTGFIVEQIRCIAFAILQFLLPGAVLSRLPKFLVDIIMITGNVFPTFILAMAVVGIISDGINKNLHLSLYLIISFLGTAMLPYASTQGIRYVIPVLPIILIFSAYGLKTLKNKFSELFKHPREKSETKKKVYFALSSVITIILSVAALSNIAKLDIKTQQINNTTGDYSQIIDNNKFYKSYGNVYSPSKIEMYNYIRDNIDKDALITSEKSRSLYLNTGRLGFPYDTRRIKDADYLLIENVLYNYYDSGLDKKSEFAADFKSFKLIYQNDELSLMQKMTD